MKRIKMHLPKKMFSILVSLLLMMNTCISPQNMSSKTGRKKTGLNCSNYAAQKEYSDKIKNQIIETLKKNDPEGFLPIKSLSEVIPELCGHPYDNFMNYIDLDRYDGYLENNLGTIVHEAYHDYSHFFGFYLKGKIIPDPAPGDGSDKAIWFSHDHRYYAFYFSDSGHHTVRVTKTFPSTELINVIPANLQNFYFEPYIDGNPMVITQVYGVYGLLDEFHSYYHDFMTHRKFEKGVRGRFISRTAFVEFKYFILTYLLHAKEKHPEIYKGIMRNNEFMKVFISVHDKFQAAVDQYQAKELNLLKEERLKSFEAKKEKLEAEGWTISLKKEDILQGAIDDYNNWHYVKAMKRFQTELVKEQYRELMNLMRRL